MKLSIITSTRASVQRVRVRGLEDGRREREMKNFWNCTYCTFPSENFFKDEFNKLKATFPRFQIRHQVTNDFNLRLCLFTLDGYKCIILFFYNFYNYKIFFYKTIISNYWKLKQSCISGLWEKSQWLKDRFLKFPCFDFWNVEVYLWKCFSYLSQIYLRIKKLL